MVFSDIHRLMVLATNRIGKIHRSIFIEVLPHRLAGVAPGIPSVNAVSLVVIAC